MYSSGSQHRTIDGQPATVTVALDGVDRRMVTISFEGERVTAAFRSYG